MRDVRSMTGTAGLRRVADFEAILLAIAGLDLREPRRGSRFSIFVGLSEEEEYEARHRARRETATNSVEVS
jgi:hypothetical protein